jgi:DNA-directed RNA polymerase specialized sigma24 family protein
MGMGSDVMAYQTDVVPISRPSRLRESRVAESEEAGDDVFRVERTRLIAYLSYQGFAPHVADEAATYALVEAWERSVYQDGRGRWLRTTATRAAYRVAKDSPATRLLEKGYRPPNAELDGTEVYRVVDRHDEIVKAMQSLPASQRSAMALLLLELTPKEIAKELRIPLRTVYGLLTKAREHLRSVILPATPKEGTK